MSEFASSFVATRYLLGARGQDLEQGLEREPYAAGRELARALANPEQAQRARALAAPLRTLVSALEALYLRA